MNSKVAIASLGSITIISLAIILVVVPILLGKDPCTEVETPAGKFKFCQGQPPAPVEASVPPNNIALPTPPEAPTNTTEIAETIETAGNEVTIGFATPPLNTIAGNWNVQGQTRTGLQFFGTFTFGANNQFAAIYNIDGYVQPVQYGTYEYSPSQGSLTLTYYSQAPDFYTVKSTSENSFKIDGPVGTASFVRT